MQSKLMKAMVWTDYGPPEVLQLREIKKPSPRKNEVLIRVRATTVLSADCDLRNFHMQGIYQPLLRLIIGLRKPVRFKMLGQELSGVVESVGRNATKFKVGDPVYAPTMFRLGTTAEYKCLPEKYLVAKPAGMTHAQAATIPVGGINALDFLTVAKVQAGEMVLINGAGGSIGTYAVQMARSLGAVVTAVDSREKLDMLSSIGADHVMDYAKEDFTMTGEKYDVVIDVIGKSPYLGSIQALAPNGRYILGNTNPSATPAARRIPLTQGRQVITALAKHKPEYYAFLNEQIVSGKLTPILDKVYPLEQLAEAHRYIEAGHQKGNVVITVE
jgi:NADPH:quinone reductase-like Zn-dependent oxidoreductase